MKHLELTLDLVPKGAWGNNLREVLSKKDWDTLRHACYERANYHCVACGAKTKKLDAHEVWDYNIKAETQTLVDIVALCSLCHLVKHIMHAEAEEKLDIATRHFYKVNQCNPDTFAKHYMESLELYEELNKVERWELCAPNLAELGGKGIEIKTKIIIEIMDPYDKVDWESVLHIRTSESESEQGYTTTLVKDSVPLATYSCVCKDRDLLCPKINAIEIKCETMIVQAKRANKIEWILNGEIVHIVVCRLKYMQTSFKVSQAVTKATKRANIYFRLFGEGGQTVSLPFDLVGV